MRHYQETRTRVDAPIGSGDRKTAVIADDGIEVALVLLDGTQPTDAGAHFHHRGRTWVIRGHRHHSGVLVAEPVATLRL